MTRMSGFRGGSRVIRLRAWLLLHFSAGLGFEEWEITPSSTQIQVMPLLRTLLSALLLVLSVSEPLNSPEENENEVFKHPEAEHTKSQATLESLTTTVPPSTSLPPQCPGNQVKLENSSVCSCPSGMVKEGDNCSCPGGFTLEGAAGCKAAPLTTTVPPSTSLPPQCPGNQVKLENSTVCSCPSGMVKDRDNCSCPGGFTLEGAAGCKAAPLTTTVSPSTSLPPQCRGNEVKLENSTVCSCPSGMVKDGDNCSCPGGFTLEGPQVSGNQVKLENSTVCSCPSGMVKDGDNCSCPGGFTLEGAAGCKAAPLTTTVSPSTSLPPQCPGNQVKLENSTVCSCPSGMVKDGDNCSCPGGFTLEGAAGCKAAPLTTTVSPSTSLPPQCPGNQVKLENSTVCSCPSGMVKDGDNCSCPGGFTLEGAAGCKAAPLTTTVSPSTSLPPQCPGNQVKLENSTVSSCPSGMVKDGDNYVDECEAGGQCGLHADCTNTPGSYSCSCLRGYLMGAGGCKDIDECALAAVTGLQACHGDAECRNTPGAFTCSCPAGYVMALNGQSCVDVDECSFEDQCRSELGNECVNTPGSFTCRCRPGFRAEAPACVDVDECSESPAVCDGQGVCENTLGSYKCVCRPGYRGNGTHCADKNECASGDHGCDINASCGNIIGSYFCQCYQGFNGDGHSCFDIDECALNNGHCQHNCSNQPGSFSCRCASGYQLLQDGLTCTDVDECLAVNGTCDHICMNTQGSFQCSCRAGYQLHIDSHTCVDVTSCKLRNGGCEHVCSVRAEGQIRCSCTAGWKLGDDQRSCVDVNECGDFTNGGCEQLCVNHPGGFHCSCRGATRWKLTTAPTVCNTQCQNYGVCVAPNSCDCPPGYPGLGCSASCSPPCAHGGTCMRWNKCLCPPGWKGAGCHTAVCELPCANGGRCVGPETCQCPSDYTGPQCLLPLTTPCVPPCQHGATCSPPQHLHLSRGDGRPALRSCELNQARVYLQAYMVGYKTQCPGKKG
ncbi:hypothetical protein F7725_027436 [Dissostichus mawsoni]|uniref:EGF-like domain-containing protein n=1 Tax=Dissostichus mawsoni TaxID=36200 RepID=A0A7J5XF03_DISMA|nr:hypothetical protein F7725_027436 [Dissostichus mawsoni]